ncbi:unnamed protein product [Diamesa hyperborea]
MNQIIEKIDSIHNLFLEKDQVKDTNRGFISSLKVMPKLEDIREKNKMTIKSIKETIINSKKVREDSMELDERISLLLKGYTFIMPPEYYEPILELEEPLIRTEESVAINKNQTSANSSEKKRSPSYKSISMREKLSQNLTATDDLHRKLQRSTITSKEDERFDLEDSNIVKKPLLREGTKQNYFSRWRRDTSRSIPSKRDGKYF